MHFTASKQPINDFRAFPGLQGFPGLLSAVLSRRSGSEVVRALAKLVFPVHPQRQILRARAMAKNRLYGKIVKSKTGQGMREKKSACSFLLVRLLVAHHLEAVTLTEKPETLSPRWRRLSFALAPSPAELRSMFADLRGFFGHCEALAPVLGVSVVVVRKWWAGDIVRVNAAARRVVWALWCAVFAPERVRSSFDWITWGRFRSVSPRKCAKPSSCVSQYPAGGSPPLVLREPEDTRAPAPALARAKRRARIKGKRHCAKTARAKATSGAPLVGGGSSHVAHPLNMP